jgi:ribosomal protein S18 acetylase RimI-like enzyme
VSGIIVSLHLRHLIEADRDRIEEITRSTGIFREEELPVALEVFDEATGGAPGNTYSVLGAESDHRLAGWIYDLYWMAVDPELQGSGIGTALLVEMERRLKGVARLIVIETAGRPEYAPTRAFYQARGYSPVSSIPDFYAPGDDQVVFVKSVRGEQ